MSLSQLQDAPPKVCEIEISPVLPAFLPVVQLFDSITRWRIINSCTSGTQWKCMHAQVLTYIWPLNLFFSSFKSIIPSAVMCSFSPMLDSWRFILFWCRHILCADIRTRQRSDLPFWTGRVNLVAVCGHHLPFLPITGAFSSCLHWIRPCDGSFLRGLARGLISKEVPLGSSSKPLELPLQPSRGILLPRRWHSAVTRPSLHLLYQSAFSTVFPFIPSPTATI